MSEPSDRVTAFLITTGEPSTAECRRRLMAQSLLPRVEVIANVAPMDRAFQQMLDRCQTPLYVQVDADMLLEPWAIHRLVEEIDKQPPEVALYVGWLWGDAEERPIQGVKIYRHEITRRFPYRSSLSCEMPQIEAMRAAGHGFASQQQPTDRASCLGLHFSLQSPAIAFARQKRIAQKFRARPYMAWWQGYPRRYLDQWKANPTAINEASALGAIAGLVGPPPPESEIDARRADSDYRRLMFMVGDWSKGPIALNLYVTDRCNAKCPMCWRALHPVDPPAEFPADMLSHVLDTFPTIQGVCLAGFGEPLLHPHLRTMVKTCRDRRIFVGVISNGLLLASRIEMLAECKPDRITVSLNATTAKHHAALQGGTDGWGTVLAGIKASRAAGLCVGLSYIATRESVQHLPALLDLARELDAVFIDIPNLLPHEGATSPAFRDHVLTVNSPELALVEKAKTLPGADIVGHWPTPIDFDNPPPRKCDSPFKSIGIDARGFVSPCRRLVSPSSSYGHYTRGNVWGDIPFVHLRIAMTGDRELPEECRACFGCWSG